MLCLPRQAKEENLRELHKDTYVVQMDKPMYVCYTNICSWSSLVEARHIWHIVDTTMKNLYNHTLVICQKKSQTIFCMLSSFTEVVLEMFTSCSVLSDLFDDIAFDNMIDDATTAAPLLVIALLSKSAPRHPLQLLFITINCQILPTTFIATCSLHCSQLGWLTFIVVSGSHVFISFSVVIMCTWWKLLL